MQLETWLVVTPIVMALGLAVFFIARGALWHINADVNMHKHILDRVQGIEQVMARYERALTEAWSRDMQFAKHQLRLARRIEALEARIGTDADMAQLRAHVAELRRRCEDDGR
jgi:cytochrome c556